MRLLPIPLTLAATALAAPLHAPATAHSSNREGTRPALHDAARRRGGAQDHRREGGVSGFAFSPDGRWLVYRSGEGAPAGSTGLRPMTWRAPSRGSSPMVRRASTDGTSPQTAAASTSRAPIRLTRTRRSGANRASPSTSATRSLRCRACGAWMWPARKSVARPTTRRTASTTSRISDDGRWIGITGGSPERYERNITASRLYADLYLMEAATGEIERLTDNYEVGEGGLSFSPDGRWIAFRRRTTWSATR